MTMGDEVPFTQDPVKWAETFCQQFTVALRTGARRDDADDWEMGLMAGWFANALQAGRSHQPEDRMAERMAYLFGCLFRMAERGNREAETLLRDYRDHFDSGDLLP